MTMSRLTDKISNLGLDILGALLVLAVVGVVLGLLWSQQGQINSLGTTVNHVATSQKANTPKVKSAAKNSATAAKAAQDSEEVVSDIPAFVKAITAGQAQLNVDLLWLECAEFYGAGACGQPPGVPVLPPPSTPGPAPSSSQGASSVRSTPATPSGGPAPTTTPPRHGKARGHR